MNENDNNRTKSHDGREDLTGEHKWGDAGQMILLLIFLTAWIADSFFTETTTFLTVYFPSILRLIIAIPVLIISFHMAKKGLNIVFGENSDGSSVIREGYFRIVRHPIYLSAILLYFGLIILTLSLIATGIWFGIIVFYYFIARYEEKILTARFGDEYRAYMKEVPMLFPKFWK